MRVFAPQGRHVAPMGVKLGMQEGTEGRKGPKVPSSVPISPHRCNDKTIGPQKLKFLLRYDQNEEYKRPAGVYPFRDFHKIYRISTPFYDALTVKISLNLLKGFRSYGGFKLTVSGYPQIFSAS